MGKAKKARTDRGWCVGSHFSQTFNLSSLRHFCIRACCWWSYNSIYRLTTRNIFQGKGWVSNLLNLNLSHDLLIFPSLESTLRKLQVSDEMRVHREENSSCAFEMGLATAVIYLFFSPSSHTLPLKWSWFSWVWGKWQHQIKSWVALWLIHAYFFVTFWNKHCGQSFSSIFF